MSDSPPIGCSVEIRRLAPGDTMPVSAADRLHVHAVFEGTCWLMRDRHPAVRVKRGELVWCSGATESMLRASEPAEIMCATYLFRAAHELVGRLRAEEVMREPALETVLRLLRTEIDRTDVARALLQPLLALLSRASGKPLYDAAPSIEDPLVARALAALQADPARAWSVEELARHVGSSRAALARRFVAELGTPPMRALVEHRMRLADRLLAETDRSLAEIALEIGYESEFAFSRAFKRERGESPGVFRRRIRSEIRRSHDPIRSAA